MRRQLTHEWLVSQNVGVVDNEVYHDTPRTGFAKLNPTISVRHHKYGKDVSYYLVGWYNRYEHKQYVFPLHRLLYAWYHGEVADGYDIDHINGNTLDNSFENLQMITHQENIQKRLGGGANQYKNCKKVK